MLDQLTDEEVRKLLEEGRILGGEARKEMEKHSVIDPEIWNLVLR